MPPNDQGPISVGIDIGSTATKAVVLADRVLGQAVTPTGWDPKKAGLQVLDEALEAAGVAQDRVGAIIGTGYGRISLPIFTRRVTEITCHALGAHFLHPATRTVIDIGGQDCKVIALDEQGAVSDFIMNDKCAAGTGRFLQVMAASLDVSLEELGALAATAEPVPLSSMCTVFAESEVIGLLARGVEKAGIAAGIIDTIARRLHCLAGKVPLRDSVIFTGGIAQNCDICEKIAASLSTELHVPACPQFVGALGAALIGHEITTSFSPE
ncbi:acyl-CoA dehydratase activase [Syntrophotalea acetylenica]|uniref:acyl-CoA dehydratase activase n=1 Tax=Syntrophotalea acetylenica TaxID=29542 RepID=UPI002A35CDF1|nr:acyl-CoA dehydratase activase [Syntrophotalea acetylenica]MDY0263225.1 acyl-CoA dehydratase activase [Syntrophotalea acetylenica]